MLCSHGFFLCLLVLIVYCTSTTGSNISRSGREDGSKVGVRAVFIDCGTDEGQSVSSETEESRFQRQEQFKHNTLHNCDKKLALTVKMANEPYHEPCDEYIAIDHVIEGSKKNRIRLLNPYILRLRREKPIEAYKLRPIEHRIKRHTKVNKISNHSFGIPNSVNNQISPTTTESLSNSTDLKQPLCTQTNDELKQRNKRYESYMNTPLVNLEDKPLKLHSSELSYIQADPEALTIDDKDTIKDPSPVEVEYKVNKDEIKQRDAPINTADKQRDERKKESVKHVTVQVKTPKSNYIKTERSIRKINKEKRKEVTRLKERKFFLYEIKNADVWTDVHVQLFEKLLTADGKTAWNDLTGESFLVNSLTPEFHGDSISVRYRQAEWVPKEHFYLPTDSLCLVVPQKDIEENERDEYDDFDDHIIVPMEDIVDLEKKETKIHRNDNASEQSKDQGSSLVIRRVQVRTSRAIWIGSKDEYNISQHGDDKYLTLPHRRLYRSQLEVEARADDNQLVRIGSSGRIPLVVTDNSRKTRAKITVQATNTGLAAARFRITTRDCGPDLEGARRKHEIVGETVVVIPPMHTHRVHLEIPFETPAGSAQCTVALLNDGDNAVAIREVPIKKEDRCFCVWHCECVCIAISTSIERLPEEQLILFSHQQHPGDDPKLLCKDMSETRQVAAGLTPRDRSRHVRSACYKDSQSINAAVVSVGVVYVLLIMGILKALLGLCCTCIGWWGLDRIVQTPRRLDSYYEAHLAGRAVRYDSDGWPIHPDTGERSVRLISGLMEFVLNTMFFLIWPFAVIYSSVVETTCPPDCENRNCNELGSTTKCFSSHDIQGTQPRWRRHRVMESRKWMTPEAEWLSEDIWNKGLGICPNRTDEYTKQSEPQLKDISYINPEIQRGASRQWMRPNAEGLSGDLWDKALAINPKTDITENHRENQEMHPLLQDEFIPKPDIVCNSSPESGMDDTQFVVMQMKKSRDSLARSQKIINGSASALMSPRTPRSQEKMKAEGKYK